MNGKLRRWIINRWVVLAEVMGFIMAGTVLIAVLYSLFVKVEILAHATGELHPRSVAVEIDEESVLVQYVVDSGQPVKANEPVCTVATDPVDRRRILATRRVAQAREMLEGDTQEQVAQVVNDAYRALESLPTIKTLEIVNASAAGVLKRAYDLEKYDTIPAGEALAVIYDMAELVIEGALEPTDEGTVEPGHDARATVTGWDGVLTGRVDAVDSGEDGTTVTLRFLDVPDEAQDIFYSILFEDENHGVLPVVRAAIIVGRKTLFKEVFGRTGSGPAPPG